MSDPCVLTVKQLGGEAASRNCDSIPDAMARVQNLLFKMNKDRDYDTPFSVEITRISDGSVYAPTIYKTRLLGGWLYTMDPIVCEGVMVSTPVVVAF